MFSFNFECSHLGWEPAPWGEGARVWVRAAAPVGLGGLAAIRRPPRTAGATDCAQGRGGGGTMRQKGMCAPELRGRRGLTCDMRGCLRPIEIRLGARPLGGGRTGMGAGGSSCGVAGRAALPWDPPLPSRRGYRLRPWAGRRGDNAPKRHLCPRITGAKGVNLRYA